jgi:peroxiredoxin
MERNMKTYIISKQTLAFLFIGALIFSGCAIIQKLGESGSDDNMVDYALSSNGATVSASNYTPGHSPLTAINGIISSEGWDDGEGWECRFERNHPRTGGWSRLDPRSKIEFGAAWLEVQFSDPKLINKVIVYTLDSAKYPASRYGIREAWLQLWKEYGWTTVGEIDAGSIVSRDNLDREPAGGKILFKFEPVRTDKLRFVVFESNDVVSTKPTDERRIDKSVARVVEIVATGLEFMDTTPVKQAQLKPAPEFSLENMDGQRVRLSDFRGNVVIVTFWAAWSPDSKRQMRELKQLNNQYADQNVEIIGISVNEGGAERIRPFVRENGLNYTILIADTGVKKDYGGVGSLPTIFVIDQEGNIYKEYNKYQGKHILELDIEKLLEDE